MSWGTDWPPVYSTNPSAATDVDLYDWLIKVWKACRERGWAAGNEFFPRTTIVHDTEPSPTSYAIAPGYTGVVDNLTTADGGATYTLTDSSKAWPVNRWNNFDNTATPWQPRYYEVIIEHDELEPWGVVRCYISANTATGLTIQGINILNAVTAGQFPSVASLIGNRYCILRQNQTGHRSLHWNERWLDWPNCNEYFKGLVASTSVAGGAMTLVDNTAVGDGRTFDEFYDILFAVSGKLYRQTITTNTPLVLGQISFTFPDPGVSVPTSTPYVVVKIGQRWAFNRPKSYPWRWYGGFDRLTPGAINNPARYSHYPDNALYLTPVASAAITTYEDGIVGCDQITRDVMDVDFWTGYDGVGATCSLALADKPFTPDFYKSLRGIQQLLENSSTFFVEAKNYDNKVEIPTFVPATWFKSFNLNAYTVTVTGVDTITKRLTFSPAIVNANLVATDYPRAVHWAVLTDPVGVVATSPTGYGSTGSLASSTTLDVPAVDAAWVGLTLIIGLGWTRQFPRTFKYYYDKAAFLPDTNTGTGFLEDPPTSAFPGKYLSRAASTNYCVADSFGQMIEGPEPFIDGLVARYVGDNWNDPTTSDAGPSIDPDTYYRDRLVTDWRKPVRGTATSATTFSLTDTTQDFNESGVLQIETGTATAGSTTGLTDSTKSTNGFWNGTNGRTWVKFTVEVEDTDGTVHKRPIATHSGTSITWAPALPFSASGKVYRIKQPRYVLNDWAGRTLQWTGADGLQHSAGITSNDADTLFFTAVSAAIAPVAGCTYSISERQPGETFQRDGASWIQPTGADPRGGSWSPDPHGNLPHVKTTYGKMMKGDYVTLGLLLEIYNGLNVMVWTKGGGEWVWPYTPTKNYHRVAYNNDGVPWQDWPYVKGQISSLYALNDNLTGVTTEPPGMSSELVGGTTDYRSGSLTSIEGYFQTTSPTTRMNHTAQAYVWVGMDKFDTEPFVTSGESREFSNHGKNVYFRKWGKILDGLPTNTVSEVLTIGDALAVPVYPRTPGTNDIAFLGWSVVGNPIVIKKWNVSGGFTYVAPVVGIPASAYASAGPLSFGAL